MESIQSTQNTEFFDKELDEYELEEFNKNRNFFKLMEKFF